MNKRELDFAVFCIEGIAERLNMNGSQAYDLLTSKSEILDEYIIKFFLPLHTQSKEYIISDIIEHMQQQGVLR